MNTAFSLQITDPSDTIISYARHFTVAGTIRHTRPVPEDAVLTICLKDGRSTVIRHTRQDRKNNGSLYTDHPMLTRYPAVCDPDFQKMKAFGFPELLVRDADNPLASLRDATIKCYYSDDFFKSFIVSATDTAHGAIWNDGIGFTDENGDPYDVLPCGNYTIEATLSSADGTRLAFAEKSVVIGHLEHQALCRFNPRAHKEKMIRWCQSIGCSISNDVLPGYLDPYLGVWQYHMGLLPMYRANDIAFYTRAKIHMFVYLIDPTSTSYETELAYLQAQGVVGDPNRFAAYHYDIGEAVIGRGKPYEQAGKIIPFAEDTYLAVCRVDVVNEKAKENVYDLNEEAVIACHTDASTVTVSPEETVAVMGVVRPWQLDKNDFVLTDENVYKITDSVKTVHYTFRVEDTEEHDERPLLMERIDGQSIGTSVYEFYHLFRIRREWAGKTVTVTVRAADRTGIHPLAVDTITLCVGEQ